MQPLEHRQHVSGTGNPDLRETASDKPAVFEADGSNHPWPIRPDLPEDRRLIAVKTIVLHGNVIDQDEDGGALDYAPLECHVSDNTFVPCD